MLPPLQNPAADCEILHCEFVFFSACEKAAKKFICKISWKFMEEIILNSVQWYGNAGKRKNRKTKSHVNR